MTSMCTCSRSDVVARDEALTQGIAGEQPGGKRFGRGRLEPLLEQATGGRYLRAEARRDDA